MSRELEGWRRYAAVFVGMLVAAGICYQASRFAVSPRGTIGPTMFQAQAPATATFAMVVLFAVSTAVAAYVGRLVNTAVGLFILGAGLWALRLRLGTIEDVAFAGGSLGLVAVETIFWGLLVLGATLAIFRLAGPLSDITADEPGEAPAKVWDELGLRGAAAGILVIPAVWLFARSDLKGQTLAAVVLGAMAVGLVGRLLAPHAQPRLLFAIPCLFGALGQLAAMVMVRESLTDAYVAKAIPAVGMPMPIDYAAGSLMGVAMGLGWAKSFLHQEETAPETT
ncbi:MAG: hypothetical protein ACYTGD_06280 [Planctomycetota bacterium]|jgi:hypothetical protein